MTNPTSNFGWQMPTNTDLVTDLPADFEVFGQAVDTSMADLKGGTTGQILSKATGTNMDFTWITNVVGDITEVNTTAPLAGGATSGAITLSVTGATTSATGVVQLSDSTSTTSSVLAATPTAVKSAYDLANGAIAKSTVTTAGDIIYRNGTVPTRLGIGTAGQVLKVNSGATAPEWAAASSSATSYALINTGGTALTGAQTTTISGLSGYNKLMVLVKSASEDTGGAPVFTFRLNGDSGANYNGYGGYIYAPVSWTPAVVAQISSSSATSITWAYPSGSSSSTASGYIEIDGANSSGIKTLKYASGSSVSGNDSQRNVTGGGYYTGTSVISSISFTTSTALFDGGTVYVYGAN